MTKKIKRPLLVTLLAVGVLILTVYNATRFGTALAEWDLLLKFMPRPGPIYIAATGLFWTFVLLVAALSLWFGWRWARPTAAISIFVYAAYYWLDRLIYQSSVPRENQPFSLIVTIVFLCLTALVLLLPGSRKFFTKRE